MNTYEYERGGLNETNGNLAGAKKEGAFPAKLGTEVGYYPRSPRAE